MSFLKKLAERTHQAAIEAANAAQAKYEGMRATDEQREERYDICKQCPHYISITTSCTQCGCFMAAKTYLAGAECPIGKWKVIQIAIDK
jgi:hypothetical protein